MQTDTIEAFNERVRAGNARFEAMTPSRKRIEIARDVLRQIRLGRINPQHGTYFDATREGPDACEVTDATQVRDLTQQIESCSACALGSVFMCAVNRADALKVGDLQGFNASRLAARKRGMHFKSFDMRSYLMRFFSMDQLLLIENAFEGGDVNGLTEVQAHNPRVTERTMRAVARYNERYLGDAARCLERIMRNIEAHGGRFDWTDRRAF